MSGIYPCLGACYECGGMCERLVYETHHESGIGLCRMCYEDLNRPTTEELVDRGEMEEQGDEPNE